LADHLSNTDWNNAAPTAGHLDNSIYKPREYFQVRGNIHCVISHPGFVQLFIGDAAAGSVDRLGNKDHPGFAINHWVDPG